MNEHRKTFVVGGTGQTVRRSRCVYISDDYRILEASVNNSLPIVGISQEYCRNPPGTPFNTSLEAGSTDDEVMVYVDGADGVPAECGGTVTAGKYVTSDGTARIVDAGGAPPWSMFVIGVALEDGAAGDIVRINVRPR